jgi:RHS repeat-associated protein
LPGGEGLSYYNARWYDAKLGRFLSADSLVPGPGNPQAFNRYAYVFNNPLRYTGPSGHCPSGYCMLDDPGSGGGGKNNAQNTQAIFLPVVHNQAPPAVSAWNSGSQYSEWNEPSSPYSGCFKCHAAVVNGQNCVDERRTC